MGCGCGVDRRRSAPRCGAGHRDHRVCLRECGYMHRCAPNRSRGQGCLSRRGGVHCAGRQRRYADGRESPATSVRSRARRRNGADALRSGGDRQLPCDRSEHERRRQLHPLHRSEHLFRDADGGRAVDLRPERRRAASQDIPRGGHAHHQRSGGADHGRRVQPPLLCRCGSDLFGDHSAPCHRRDCDQPLHHRTVPEWSRHQFARHIVDRRLLAERQQVSRRRALHARDAHEWPFHGNAESAAGYGPDAGRDLLGQYGDGQQSFFGRIHRGHQ